MSEPLWLSLELVLAIHNELIAEFGGPEGVRDEGALDAALSRPRNRWHYERSDLPALAAAYAFGIAKNHPFIDGNKRTAFVALTTFLGLNEIDFSAPEPEAVVMMLGVAAGEFDEESLSRWLRDRLPGL